MTDSKMLTATQETMLRKLREITGLEDLSVDPPKVIAAMDGKYGFSTTRNVLVALKRGYPECAAFQEEFKTRCVKFQAMDQTQEPTAKQREKFLDWENLILFREGFKDRLSDMEYFALCLYTMWEPARCDYTPMKVVTRKPRQLEDGVNYLLVHENDIVVLFHAFKTHKKLGDVTRKMPRDLEWHTRRWLKAHPGTYLFQDKSGKPMTEQAFGEMIMAPFRRIYDMRVGISMIRHAYATWINRDVPSLADMKKTATGMLHSIEMNQKYRFLKMD